MTRRLALLALWPAKSILRSARGIVPPKLIYQVRPEYPKLAREARIQGVVRLQALIDKEGAVARLKLISGHPLLVKAAMDAVRQWRYLPARSQGVVMSFSIGIDVPFSLGPERAVIHSV